MSDQPKWLLTPGWISTDKPDYEYAPRIEHWFDGESEYSYCGMIGMWQTNHKQRARRRCRWCIMHMIREGKLRIVGTTRGTW